MCTYHEQQSVLNGDELSTGLIYLYADAALVVWSCQHASLMSLLGVHKFLQRIIFCGDSNTMVMLANVHWSLVTADSEKALIGASFWMISLSYHQSDHSAQ